MHVATTTKRAPEMLDGMARLLSAEIPGPPPEAGSRGFFDAGITAFGRGTAEVGAGARGPRDQVMWIWLVIGSSLLFLRTCVIAMSHPGAIRRQDIPSM